MAQPHALQARGGGPSVDGRDVAAWAGAIGPADGGDPVWRERAAEYVEAHPRPPSGAGASGVAAAQRTLVLRRLAAGPASRAELLAVMRRAGWVGAADLENRLRELRGTGARAPTRAGAIPVAADGDRWSLAEPLPLLDDAAVRALGFAKAMVRRLSGPLAAQASAALDGLLPGVRPGMGGRGATGMSAAQYRASARVLQVFEAALQQHRPLRVQYFSMNSGMQRTYELVPVEHVPFGPVTRAICVPVDSDGRRAGDDRQFALDRLIDAVALPDWPAPPPEDLVLRRSPIVLVVTRELYEVMRSRDLFGITGAPPEEVEVDVWQVAGDFPVALAWDVMEQLCAWAGTAQVLEPLWLVNAVSRRLRAGLAVMEQAADFVLVKPDADTELADLGQALTADGPADLTPAPRDGAARRLPPRRRA